ncbi:hypothetical protein BDF14DRAFT_1882440 [Spinellus fusiger]|nr:hypothetical protein BDF14DRAFT_1882440 [Spinellus fusiger]
MKFTLAFLSLASAVVAFENTVPCLVWSPKNYVHSSSSSTAASEQLYLGTEEAISSILAALGPSACQAKLVAVVDQPELHSSDFSRPDYKEAFSLIKEHVTAAHTRVQFEHIAAPMDVTSLATALAQQCDSTLSLLEADSVSPGDLYHFKSHSVALVTLPAGDNAETLKKNDATVDTLIRSVESVVNDDYIVIYTSSTPKTSSLQKRGPYGAKLPIFAKYQLFTPAIFMGLFVSFIFIIVVAMGVSWVSGIQTPTRFENKPKK